MGAWLPEEVGAGEEVWELVDAHARAVERADAASRAMYLDQRFYLADGVLTKVDRAAMAHGIEVRSPFLDHAIVELAASMGIGHKLRGTETKRVLRRAFQGMLPPEVLARRKHGFGAPVGTWLRGPCRSLLDGLAEGVEGFLDPDLVQRVVAEHVDGRADHRRRLWAALVLARWRAGPWGP
jgi:asparagine synthase (glutamine-hydrolysing)